jgi:hypothetical protein
MLEIAQLALDVKDPLLVKVGLRKVRLDGYRFTVFFIWHSPPSLGVLK